MKLFLKDDGNSIPFTKSKKVVNHDETPLFGISITGMRKNMTMGIL